MGVVGARIPLRVFPMTVTADRVTHALANSVARLSLSVSAARGLLRIVTATMTVVIVIALQRSNLRILYNKTAR